MDPLTVLPVEVVEKVVRLLAPADLLSLAGVSRAWRRWAKDPALWGAVRLRFPGDPPALLRLATAIDHLELRVADLAPRHLRALQAGPDEVQRLTCLPSAEKKTTDAATLVSILQRVAPSLRSLKVLVGVNGRTGRSGVKEDTERALKIIFAMPRLRELRLGQMSLDFSDYPERSVQVPLRGTLETLRIDGRPSYSWANTVLNLLRAHRTSLRSLELAHMSPRNGAVVNSIAQCSELRSLVLEVPLASHKYGLVYQHHTRRIFRQLPKALTHLEHLKLLLPCPFDVEGAGLDALAAGLRKHCKTTLLSLELVVLCAAPGRVARVEANEARLRAALPNTATVRARVEKAYCYCTAVYAEDYDNEPDAMVDTYYETAGEDASRYATSDDEENDA